MLDPQDELYDRRLAAHLVSLYFHGAQEDEEANLDMSILRDYLTYAKTYVHPTIGEEAGQALIQAYVEMRQVCTCHYLLNGIDRLELFERLSDVRKDLCTSYNRGRSGTSFDSGQC